MRVRGVAACLALTLALAGCHGPVRLVATPLQPWIDAGARTAVARDEARAALSLVYATNRQAPLGGSSAVYLPLAGDALHFGRAELGIDAPGATWRDVEHALQAHGATAGPVVHVEDLEPLATSPLQATAGASPELDAFFASIDAALARSGRQDLVVFVHGANTTMRRALAQAGQLLYFAGRERPVLSFVWPSAGPSYRYAGDAVRARASSAAFARLLEALAERTATRRIDVVAYSAGGAVASGGLALAATPRDGESRAALRDRLRFGTVYFAAPDEDTRRFVDDLERYVDLAERVTLTVNRRDVALGFAQWWHRGSRAGRPDVRELDAARAGVVAQASLEGGLDVLLLDPVVIPGLRPRAHDYFKSDPWVSSDLVLQLAGRRAAAERALEPYDLVDGIRVWRFPTDYERRLRELLEVPGAAAAAP